MQEKEIIGKQINIDKFIKKYLSTKQLIQEFYQNKFIKLVRRRDRGIFIGILLLIFENLFIFLASITNINVSDLDNNLEKLVDAFKDIIILEPVNISLLAINISLLVSLLLLLILSVKKQKKLYDSSQKYIFLKSFRNTQKWSFNYVYLVKDYFSLFSMVYRQIIFLPILYASVNQISLLNAINILISLILGNHKIYLSLFQNIFYQIEFLINDSDYEFTLQSKDFLSKPYSKASNILIAADVLVISIIQIGGNEFLFTIPIYFLMKSSINNIYLRYNNYQTEKVNNFLVVYFILVSFLVLIITSSNSQNNISFKFWMIVIAPISFKIGQLIIQMQKEKHTQNLWSLYGENTDIQNLNQLNQIIRLDVFKEKQILSEIGCQLIYLLSINNTGQAYLSFENTSQNIQIQQEKLNSSPLYEINMQKNKLKDTLCVEYQRLYNQSTQKNQKHLYLLALVEFFKNYQIYWITYYRYIQQKDIGIKDKQIANSIHQNFIKFRKELEESITYEEKERVMYGSLFQNANVLENQNVFYDGYLKILTFEERVQETYNQIQIASNLKLEILSLMKSKEIQVNLLLNQVNQLDQLVKKVKVNLKFISDFNYYNPLIYDLKLFYLSTVAFCQDEVSTDLHKKSGYQFSKEQINLSSHKGECVFFCTIDDNSNVVIKKSSIQIQKIFGISQKNAKDKPISSLMPSSIAAVHNNCISSYFNYIKQPINTLDYLQKQYYQQNLMQQNIIFALYNNLKSNLIVSPIKISLQLNQFLEKSDQQKGLINNFGFTALIKDLNEKNQLDYILYFTHNISIQGITKHFYEFLHNIHPLALKESSYFNLQQFFPFLNEYCGLTDPVKQSLNNVNYYFKMLNSQLEIELTMLKEKHDFSKFQQQDQNFDQKFQHITFMINQQNLILSLKQLANKKLSLNQLSDEILDSFTFVCIEIKLFNPKYQILSNLEYIEISKAAILNPQFKNKQIIEYIVNNLNMFLKVYTSEFLELLILLLENINKQNIEEIFEKEIDFSFLVNLQRSYENNLQSSENNSKQQNDLYPLNKESQEQTQNNQNLKQATLSDSFLSQTKQNQERKDDIYVKSTCDLKTINMNYINEDIFTKGQVYSIDNLSIFHQNKSQQQLQVESQTNRRLSKKTSINVNSMQNKTSNENFQQIQMTNKNTFNFGSFDKKPNQSQKCSQQFSQRVKSQESIIQLSPMSHDKLFSFKSNKKVLLQKQQEDYKHSKKSKGSSIQEEDETKQSNGFDEEENQKKLKKKLEEQIEIESQKSKESSLAHSRGRLKSYLNNNQTSNVIYITKIIGLLSYFIMIGLTIFLFIEVINVAQNSYDSSSYLVWPMKYSSNLSQAFKTQNLALLLSFKEIKTTSFEHENEKNDYIKNLKLKLNTNVLQSFMKYIASVEYIGSKQNVFNLMIQNKIIFWLGKYYDPDHLVGANPVPDTFPHTVLNVTVVYSDILISSTVYRYITGLGNGRPEYYSSRNIQTLVTILTKIQDQMLEQQVKKDNDIDQQQAINMSIIIFISFLCITTIQPLYSYIQNQRQIILKLFATFSVEQLDSMILQINHVQSHHRNKILQSTKEPIQNQNQHKEIKKQVIGRITKLKKINLGLILLMFALYLLILVSPILNRKNTSDYLNSVENISYTGQLIYEVQAFILESLSINYLSLILMIRPNLKPMKLSQYQDYLQDILKRSQTIQDNFNYLIQNQFKIKSYNSKLYDEFFFKIMEGDICNTVKQFQKYQTSYIQDKLEACYDMNKGMLSQGLNTSFKSLIQIIPELFNLLSQNNQDKIYIALNQFNQDYDLRLFNDFEEFLTETIDSVGLFLNDLSKKNYEDFISFQTILLIYELILLSLIFLVFWIQYGRFLDNQLNCTKKLLRIIDLNNLLQNQYICQHFKNNMKYF